MYDAKGRLIGIHVAARPDTAESMSVPLPVIIDEYEKALKTLSEEESED